MLDGTQMFQFKLTETIRNLFLGYANKLTINTVATATARVVAVAHQLAARATSREHILIYQFYLIFPI